MFACSVFYCSLLILYFICIFLLLLPTWRIKRMMKLMMTDDNDKGKFLVYAIFSSLNVAFIDNETQ